MPEPVISQSIDSDFDASNVDNVKVDDIDPKVLESMAAKSGQSVDELKQKLGKVDAKDNNTDPNSQDPNGSLLAGKFKTEADLQVGLENITTKLGVSPEDAAKITEALGPEDAYKHFQSKLGSAGKDDDASKAGDEKKDETKDAFNPDDGDGDNKDGEKNGGDEPSTKLTNEDFEALTKEFIENDGELSKESRDKITEFVPEAYLNQYLEGINASQELCSMKVLDAVGGEDNWDTLLDWAQSNLSNEQRQMFNTAIDLGQIDKGLEMAEALKARYEKAEGPLTVKRLSPNDSLPNQVVGYESIAQMTADMKDPRYKNGDKAFHALVQRKTKFAKFAK